MTRKPASEKVPARLSEGGIAGVLDGDMTSAAFGYLGAIFLGPVIPLIVYVLRARKSPFMRYHAATAANLSLTGALYGVCCLILGGLLLLDSITAALIVVLPVGLAIWGSTLRYLIRGVSAANRGERFEVPGWICARIVSLHFRCEPSGLGQLACHCVGQEAAAAGEHDPAGGQSTGLGEAVGDH
jgi:uncharacterized Tic20 family protein